jgi:hypothetical protein
MKSVYDNFVGIYDDCFSSEFCNNIIEYFEWCNSRNRVYTRQECDERFKNDVSTNLNPTSSIEIQFYNPNIDFLLQEFNSKFWNICYNEYLLKYSQLKDYDRHSVFAYKVQKTYPSGGYHIWHCEDGTPSYSRRIGVYILYLNDVDEGGETEFLYFPKRIYAKQGRLAIFPPNFPWTHRGNPPISNEKYIMTGWIEFS